MISFFSRLFFFISALLILLGIGVVFLPTFLNTELGKKQLEAWVNKKIPGSIEVKSLELHWGKGQKVEGFLLRDPDGQSVMGFEKLYTDASLWDLLTRSTQLGFTRIKDFNAVITTDQKGQSNLQRALDIETPPLPSAASKTISLSDVQGDFYLTRATNVPFSAHLKGTTREGSLIGSFEVDLILNGLESGTWSELKEDVQQILSIEGSKDAKINAKISNFPVDLIDQFLILQGSRPYARYLLGEKLDVFLNKEPHTDGLAFNLTMAAPFFEGSLKGKVEKNIFSLPEPALFTFTLNPESISALSNNLLANEGPSQLQITLQELQLPLSFFDNSGDGNTDYSLNMQTALSHSVWSISSSNLVEIRTLKTSLSSSLAEKQIQWQIEGAAEHESSPFELHLASKLNKPSHSNHFFDQLKKGMKASLKVSQVPLGLFLKEHPVLLGSRADIVADIQNTKNDQLFEGNLLVQTPTLQLNKMAFQVNEAVNLTSPATIKWIIPSQFFEAIFYDEKLKLDHSSVAQITLNHLSLPLNNLKEAKIGLKAGFDNFSFPNIAPEAVLKIKNMNLDVNSKNLFTWETLINLETELLNRDQSPSPLLSTPLNWSAATNFKFRKGKIEIPSLKLLAEGAAGGCQLDGALTADQVFIQNKPFSLHYRLTPAALDKLSHIFKLEHMPSLVNSSLIELRFEPTLIDLKNDWLSKLMLKGVAHIDELTIKDKYNSSILLKDIEVPLTLDARHNTLNMSLKGLGFTTLDRKPNSFSMNLKIEQWLNKNRIDLSQSKTEFSSNIIALPTSFLSELITNQDLSPLLGPYLDFELKTLIDREQQNSGYWDMNIDSTTFHARARLVLNEAITLYESKNPSAIVRWTITPQAYEFMKKYFFKNPSSAVLAEPFTMTMHLSSLNFPLSFDTQSLEKGQLTAHLSTGEMKWKDLPSISPTKIEGRIETQYLSESINLDFFTTVGGSSSLSIKGLIGDLSDHTGKLRPLDQARVNLNINANRLPSVFFKAFNLLDDQQVNKFEALWGEKVDILAQTQLQQLTGPLNAEIKGNNGQATLKGKLTKGILTLNSPFYWSIKVTPLLGKAVLEKNVPFLSSIVSAENSIKLSIDPAGFSCPLIPFNLNQASVERGIIETGKIHFLNQGSLKNTLNYLLPLSSNQLTIWFTPIFFNLQQGHLQLKRFDMLIADLYHLACWGNINLKKQDFDLALGLTAPVLNQAFGVEGLEKDYILQIPLKGREGQVEIDNTKILGRISALVAKMKGGNKGKLLGGILEIVIADKEEPLSPPLTSPLPWAPLESTKHQQEEISNPKNSSKKDKNSEKKNSSKKDSSKPDKKKLKISKEAINSFLDVVNKIY